MVPSVVVYFLVFLSNTCSKPSDILTTSHFLESLCGCRHRDTHTCLMLTMVWLSLVNSINTCVFNSVDQGPSMGCCFVSGSISSATSPSWRTEGPITGPIEVRPLR